MSATPSIWLPKISSWAKWKGEADIDLDWTHVDGTGGTVRGLSVYFVGHSARLGGSRQVLKMGLNAHHEEYWYFIGRFGPRIWIGLVCGQHLAGRHSHFHYCFLHCFFLLTRRTMRKLRLFSNLRVKKAKGTKAQHPKDAVRYIESSPRTS